MANDKIITKLGKLKAHMESAEAIGNEAEAQAFAQMLNQLLVKHNLEMSEIDYDAEVKDEPVDRFTVGGGSVYKNGEFYMKDYPDIQFKRKRCEWSERLGQIIAEAHGCKMLVVKGSSRLVFVGRKSKVMVAEYMYVIMYRSIIKMSEKANRTFRNKLRYAQVKQGVLPEQMSFREALGYRDNWIDGFVHRLDILFYDERQKEKDAEGNESTALMRINNDKQAIANWMDEQKIGTAGSIGGGYGTYNKAGREAGDAAAKDVHANSKKGVGQGNQKQLGS